ncbi:MAG: hypothetical protein U1E73_01380 [Planctomycetota bacterium]
MKLLRILYWLPAALPCGAAFVWCSLASRLPEAVEARRALGECTWKWGFAAATSFDREPAHLFARWLGLVPLQLPGMTIARSAFVLAVLAGLLTFAVARLVRRMQPATGPAHALAVGVIGLLVCSPAHGADWLYAERLGRFAVPLLFAVAATAVAGPWRARGAVLALGCAVAAPFCHDTGVLVFLALLPLLAAQGRLPWIVALVLFGNLAAGVSLWPAEHALGKAGLAAAWSRGQLLPGLGEVVHLTGALWPDVLPDREIDAWLLGGASWASPLLLLLRPRAREGQSAPAAGAAWSCIAFGLLLVLWHVERVGLPGLVDQELLPASRSELLLPGFLLPIGVIGVVATRLGAAAWLLGGGALAVLGLQGWDSGREALRAARWRVEHAEATVLLPVELGGMREKRALPTRDLEELMMLEGRGLVPRDERAWMSDMALAVTQVGDASAGAVRGGDLTAVEGTVRAHVLERQFVCVAAGAFVGGQLVDLALGLPPEVEPGTAIAPWRAPFYVPPLEGAEIMAVGYDVRGGRAVRLAGSFVVRGGKIVERSP